MGFPASLLCRGGCSTRHTPSLPKKRPSAAGRPSSLEPETLMGRLRPYGILTDRKTFLHTQKRAAHRHVLTDLHDQFAAQSFPARPDAELNDAALVTHADLDRGLSLDSKPQYVTVKPADTR